jgi:hypothetical protein
MKKIIFVALVLICAYATGFAQGKIPTAVSTAFNQKFSEATNIKWDKENAHEYEADFQWKNEKYSANFTETGEWLETESTITFSQLPEKVQDAFNSTHKGATVKAIAKIETSKNTTNYEVEYKAGAKTVEILYTVDGVEFKQ